MTVKAGQKCTAIRKALVPAAHAGEVVAALRAALGKVVVGDPRLEERAHGPGGLARAAPRGARAARQAAPRGATWSSARVRRSQPEGADAERGAFLAPTLLYCSDSRRCARGAHGGGLRSGLHAHALRLAATRPSRSRGAAAAAWSARCSAPTMPLAAQLVLGLAPYHGRIVVVNRHCAKESTGHGSPLPHLVHGGPGRAGGGEEMGGIRGVMHYLQRTAVQGTPDLHHRGDGTLDARRARARPGHASVPQALRRSSPSATRSIRPSAR